MAVVVQKQSGKVAFDLVNDNLLTKVQIQPVDVCQCVRKWLPHHLSLSLLVSYFYMMAMFVSGRFVNYSLNVYSLLV